MNIIHRYPPALAWAQEIDRLFDRGTRLFDHAPASPEIFHESGDAWHLRLDLPGFGKEDINLKVTDHTLHLVAETPEDRPFGGRFERQWKLGSGIDGTGISARLENGVLELRLPKKKPETIEPRNIEIS